MALLDDLTKEVTSILKLPWNSRDGQVVPTPDSVALADGAVKLRATMLYADLADSTKLAMRNKLMAAKVFKSFLACSSRIIRSQGGEIRSFDGDRVMGVFVGDPQCTPAAKAALMINYAFLKIIKPQLEAKYDYIKNDFTLAHCVGIDSSEVVLVRSGIINNNDLVWVGRAPNIAAKLSAFRNSPYHSYITEDTYKRLGKELRFTNETAMWEERVWTNMDKMKIYRSKWTWAVR